MWTERSEGFQVEIGPNGFLDNKPSTTGLCRDLGLEDRLLPASEAAAHNRYLFLNGKSRPLPNGLMSFLRSDLLSCAASSPCCVSVFVPSEPSLATNRLMHSFAAVLVLKQPTYWPMLWSPVSMRGIPPCSVSRLLSLVWSRWRNNTAVC